jgi:hypothetical protein
MERVSGHSGEWFLDTYGRVQQSGVFWAFEQKDDADNTRDAQTLEAVSYLPKLAPGPPDQRKTDRLMQIPHHARALRHPRRINHSFLHVH